MEQATANARAGWDAAQSRWVLPTARKLYLVGALAAIGGASLALFIALFFQLSSFRGARLEAVPTFAETAPKPIALQELDARFAGPTRLRIISDPAGQPFSEGQIVAHFEADSGAPIARQPDGFQIIGGQDGELFVASPDPANPERAVLKLTASLAKTLNALPDDQRLRRTFVLRAIAQDTNGNQSRPASVSFVVQTPAQAAETTALPPGPAVETIDGPERLRAMAAALASIAAARGTPDYIDAYDYALKEPERCGATDNERFFSEYNAAFTHLRARLTRSNLPAFYQIVCDSWRQAIADANRGNAAALAVRDAAVARNVQAEAVAAMKAAASRLARNVALTFACAAIAAFMVIALFLAFLAIESHSNAVRAAVEMLARREERTADA